MPDTAENSRTTRPGAISEACPCCGRLTLAERGGWEICPVCWWEDDGLDNDRAHLGSGPNHMTLVQGRVNVLTWGIFDPARTDLMAKQEPPDRYLRGRLFDLSEDGRTLREPAAHWECQIPR